MEADETRDEGRETRDEAELTVNIQTGCEHDCRYAPIPGFLGYRAGDDGSIWSRFRHIWGDYVLGDKWRRLKPTIISSSKKSHRKYDRLQISLRKDGKTFKFLVHDLVLISFIGPRPGNMVCCHFPDRDPLNCCLNNLRWGTQKDNMEDQKHHGTRPGGEQHHNAKLTNLQVAEIHSLSGTMSQYKLAERFGVSQSCISNILLGKRRTESSHGGRGL
jgi:hypothetical protein